MSTCTDCGTVIDPRAIRCRKCHGALERRQSLEDTAERDAAILAMVAEGLSSGRVARRLHVTRMQANRAIRRARARTAAREGR